MKGAPFLIWALAVSLPAQEPIISEFMASNARTLADQDREFSDWIEIYNAGSAPVNLNEWSLSDRRDRPGKWTFPERVLEPGSFLVVFASAKDRRDPADELHANFKLYGTGEFLGLYDPRRTLVSRLSPRYPRQVLDSSYGFPMEMTTRKLVEAGARARFLVPPSNALGTTWTKPDFDDQAWESGPTGIGFDRKPEPTYLDLIQTDVGAAMQNVNTSIYLRIPFPVAEGDLGKRVQLKVKYEDGFIAYLNGVEVARRNLSGNTPRHDSRSAQERPEREAFAFESIPLPSAAHLLQPGQNLLAIHALNNSRAGPDLLLLPELETVEVQSVLTEAGNYFAVPTPGWPNGGGFPDVTEEPLFSEGSGAFSEPFSLELLTVTENAEVRFTIDGSEPNAGSTLYASPVAINSTRVVKAKAFKAGLLPSATVSQSYVFLNAAVLGFSSNVPILIINTFGRTIGGADTAGAAGFTPGHLMVIDRAPEDGRAAMTGIPDYAGNAAFKVRGSSTSGIAKPSYAMEIRDDQGEDRDVELLGLPADSDWVLHGPYAFDLALIRNDLIFELSNQVGRYATRTRFTEVYLNTRNGPVGRGEYVGVYSLTEKIKEGKDRVNVEELLPEYDEEPLIAGGYMLKIDRLDPGDSGFTAAGQNMGFVYPKEKETPAHQKAWIRNYMDAFAKALNGPKFIDPVDGYAKYVDVDSWIDHHILNVLAKNVDALRLSGYFFKTRYGKIEMGPIWDFDRSMNSTDGRDDDPRTWNGTGDATDMFNYPWWRRLFADPAFKQRYRERWLELRAGPLSNQNIHAVINDMATELAEAQVRNFQKWGLQGAGGWQGQINLLKTWLATRADWIDSQYILPPKLSHPGGPVEEGFTVSITVPIGELFYTLNGPDPKAQNGSPAPEALRYAGPITVRENLRVRARARISARLWTPMAQGVYTTRTLPLVITEIMYNPAPAPGGPADSSDFEFIEFQNLGDGPVDLRGVRIGDRPTFDFTAGAVTALGPREYVVVVKNPDAFTSRYGSEGIKIAGPFPANQTLNNRTQTINLLGPLDETLLSFSYQAAWHPSTNGQGHSLVIRDPRAPRAAWTQAEGWRASLQVGGSPGRVDGVPNRQLRGDLNQDQRLSLSDGIAFLRNLFGGAANLPCESEAANVALMDLNGDQGLNLADAIGLLRYLFLNDTPPALGTACVPIAGCPDSCVDGGV